MEYFLFFVGFLLIVAVIFLTAEVRRLGTQLRQEQTGTERSFAAMELAFEEMMEQLEDRGKELRQELEIAAAPAEYAPVKDAPMEAAPAVAARVDPAPAVAAPVNDPRVATPVGPVETPIAHPISSAGDTPMVRPIETAVEMPTAPTVEAPAAESVQAAPSLESAAAVKPTPSEAAPVELPESARRARILAEQGMSDVEMARTLGIGRGEVQLLLSLERSQRRGDEARQSHP